MSAKIRADDAVRVKVAEQLAVAQPQQEARRRKQGLVVVYFARGQTGKTIHAVWYVDTRQAEGWAVIPADGDCGNQTLSAFFAGRDCLVPAGDGSRAMRSWLIETAEWVAAERVAVAIDLGGGDTAFQKLGNKLSQSEGETFDDLARFGIDVADLNSAGRDTTIVWTCSGEYDDTNTLRTLLSRDLVSDRTILVFSDGAVREREGATARERLENMRQTDADILAACAKWALPVFMPALRKSVMDRLIEHRVRPIAAVKGSPVGAEPLNLVERQAVARWLRDTEIAHNEVLIPGAQRADSWG